MKTSPTPAGGAAEEARARHETLSALGRLAGGVAHDFNNLLTVINSSASLLLATEDLAPPAGDSARRITAAGERAANLTRQLLLFSGQQPHHPQMLDLNALLPELTGALERLAGPAVKLDLRLANAAPLIIGDAAMLEQVLTNLVANARDALPHGGRLIVTTAAVTVTAPPPPGRAGDFLCVGVSDEGAGIAPEVLPHIFEPFFTTRAVGHGSGLGLAVVSGIVQQHEGWLEVDSTPGAGSRFRVFLPAAPAGTAVAGRAEPASLHGQETILLVEDEELVRETTAAVLKNSGYRVLQVASGAAALETWRWHAARIALLLTDVVLPEGVNGLELAEKLRAEKPTLKVIGTSGFSREMMAGMSRPPAGTIFLQKPCSPPTLAKAIRTLLDEDQP